MAAAVTSIPTIYIVGPTASGKSSVAIEVAKKHGGEIIAADSRTIYKNMDIGTAKPSKGDQALIPHFGIDLVEPGKKFSAADFQLYAKGKIEEIKLRGHIPIIVGGSGLYVDGLLFDYEFGPTDTSLRGDLEQLSIEQLQQYCAENGIEIPENRSNKRYVIRAIEQDGINKRRKSEVLKSDIVVGITTNRDDLRHRISMRIEQLFEDGVVEEARMLGKKYGWDSEAMTGNIYRILRDYLDSGITLEEAKARAVYVDWHLAKRQLTWFRRNQFISWMPVDEVMSFIDERLA